MTTERQDGSYGSSPFRSVKIVRVIRRVSVCIDDRVVGNRDTFVARDFEFSFGTRRGGHVQDDRVSSFDRNADADRVHGESRVSPAGRDDEHSESGRVHKVERHESLGGRDLSPRSNPAQVSGVPQRDDGDSVLAAFLHANRDGLPAGPLSVTEPRIGDRQRPGVDHNLNRLAGKDFLLTHPLQINRGSDDAVRIMSGQVRLDQMIGDHGGFFVAATGSRKEVSDQSFQLIRGERFHSLFLADSIPTR